MRGLYTPLIGFLVLSIAVVVGAFLFSGEMDNLSRLATYFRDNAVLTYTEIASSDISSEMHSYIRNRVYEGVEGYEREEIKNWIKNNIRTWIYDYARSLERRENIEDVRVRLGDVRIVEKDYGLQIDPNTELEVDYRTDRGTSTLKIRVSPFSLFLPDNETLEESRNEISSGVEKELDGEGILKPDKLENLKKKLEEKGWKNVEIRNKKIKKVKICKRNGAELEEAIISFEVCAGVKEWNPPGMEEIKKKPRVCKKFSFSAPNALVRIGGKEYKVDSCNEVEWEEEDGCIKVKIRGEEKATLCVVGSPSHPREGTSTTP